MFQTMHFKQRALLALLAIALAACGAPPVKIATGSPAPAFTLPAAGGGEYSLAAYQGRQPVLLFFHMADG